MASKIQTYFVYLINLQRQNNALEEISVESKDLMDLADLRDKYIKWLLDIRKEKEFEKLGSLHADDSIISDHMKNGSVGNTDRYFYVKELLQKEIALRVEFFSRLELVPKLINKILIKIEQEKKEVSIENNGRILKYPFRKSDGMSKRFEYLVTIAQNPKVGARKLSTTTYQNISSEISEINKNIKEALKLKKDLIVNERNSGYQINDLYEIDFV